MSCVSTGVNAHGSMKIMAQQNREIRYHSTLNFAYVYIQPLFSHTIDRLVSR